MKKIEGSNVASPSCDLRICHKKCPYDRANSTKILLLGQTKVIDYRADWRIDISGHTDLVPFPSTITVPTTWKFNLSGREEDGTLNALFFPVITES